ncbi:MAG: YggT family protein [Gammaproteobacteria bacterium]|nr:YggT family protein [Gammaproteobacteria bacterium]
MNNPFAFLITSLFELYVYVILIRFFLQAVRADFYNPVSQFAVKATNPVLVPLRKLIPGFGGMDVASIVFAYAVNLLKWVALAGLGFTSFGSMGYVGIVVFVLFELMYLTFGLFIFLAFIRIILSWISPGGYNPMTALIHQLTDPLFRPFQKIIPPMGGLDLSPILMFMVLYFVRQAIPYFLYPIAFSL